MLQHYKKSAPTYLYKFELNDLENINLKMIIFVEIII